MKTADEHLACKGECKKKDFCMASNKGQWACTRLKGHSGDHVACGSGSDHDLCIWPNENEPVKPITKMSTHDSSLSPCKGTCNTNKAVCCGIYDESNCFYCTLPKGHKSDHVACSTETHNVCKPWYNHSPNAYAGTGVKPPPKPIEPRDKAYFTLTIICTTGEIFFVPFLQNQSVSTSYRGIAGYHMQFQARSKWGTYGDALYITILEDKIKKLIFKCRRVTLTEFNFAKEKWLSFEQKTISETGIWPVQRGKLKAGETSAQYNAAIFKQYKGTKAYGLK